MKYNIKSLTNKDIKEVSLNYLKYIACQKNLGIEGNELIKQCKLEIKRRTTTRKIGDIKK